MKDIIRAGITGVHTYYQKKAQITEAIKDTSDTVGILGQWRPVIVDMLSNKVHRGNLIALGQVMIDAKLKDADKKNDEIEKKLLEEVTKCAIDIVKDKPLMDSIANNESGISSSFKKLLESSPEVLQKLGVNTKIDHKHVVKDLTDFSQNALKIMRDTPNETKAVITHIQTHIDLKQEDIKIMPLVLEVAPEVKKIVAHPSSNIVLNQAIKAFPNSPLAHHLAPIKLRGLGDAYLARLTSAYLSFNGKPTSSPLISSTHNGRSTSKIKMSI